MSARVRAERVLDERWRTAVMDSWPRRSAITRTIAPCRQPPPALPEQKATRMGNAAMGFGCRAALVAGLAATLAALPAAAQQASADLTGSWEGLQVCDDNRGSDQVNYVADDRVEISQAGESLHLRRVTRDGASALLYEGHVMAIGGTERVEALLTVCDGTYAAQEIVRLRRVVASAGGSGTFDAESLYQSTDAPGLAGVEIFGTCKWAYERVSTDDPGVPACRR